MGEAIVRNDGYIAHSIWEHSETVARLYRARARDEAEEMTCAAQAVELLEPFASEGDSLLDAGCGSGYFFHSLRRRAVKLAYWGIDASPRLIEIGRSELARFGLAPERLQVIRIEDFRGEADHALCMNVLSNIDNYHRPLERLLKATRKTLVLRESATTGSRYAWVRDDYLDPEVDLSVHVNAYDIEEMTDFIQRYGFTVERIADHRSGDAPENVIGYPHWWTFFRAVRTKS